MTILNKIKPYKPFGPGEQIKELITLKRWNVRKLAIEMGVKQDHINDLLNNSLTINQKQAKVLQSVFELSRQFWLNLDRNYRDNLKQ